jgi:hypothetical protein
MLEVTGDKYINLKYYVQFVRIKEVMDCKNVQSGIIKNTF